MKGFAPSTVPDVDDAKDFELEKSEIDGVSDLKLKDRAIPGNASPPKLKKVQIALHQITRLLF